jgi:signal transduction histidine kinase
MTEPQRQFQETDHAGAYDRLGVGLERTHGVRFYEDDRFFLASVGDFLATGLAVGQRVLAVVTPSHRDGLLAHLEHRGFNVERAVQRGQLTFADADVVLATFMVEGEPDPALFHASLERVFRRLERLGTYRTVRVFGEMVDVLCRAGNMPAAIALEGLWNELSRSERFSLLCAYSMESFRDVAHTPGVEAICGEHAHVIPTERYTEIDEGARLREVALLQQRAQALATEVERSRGLERSLREALGHAEAANRAKGEFLAMMSHELRTPLNAIGGHVQLVELGLHGPVTALRRVQRSQRQLLALINDVLNLARAESSEVAFATAPVELAPLIQEVTELLTPLFANGSLCCRVAIEESLIPPSVLADREKLQQILLNLLGNTLKFTPAGGTVTVRVGACSSDAAAVRIDVVDNGIGIPTAKLEEIFQPFVQLGRSSNEPREGIGLGLSISRALARGMRGNLAASSTPGGGTTLTLTLPHA